MRRTEAVVILCALYFAIGCFLIVHGITESNRQDAKREQEWRNFSKQNHCRIVREPGFWDSSEIWQCDGNFQIRRYER